MTLAYSHYDQDSNIRTLTLEMDPKAAMSAIEFDLGQRELVQWSLECPVHMSGSGGEHQYLVRHVGAGEHVHKWNITLSVKGKGSVPFVLSALHPLMRTEALNDMRRSCPVWTAPISWVATHSEWVL